MTTTKNLTRSRSWKLGSALTLALLMFGCQKTPAQTHPTSEPGASGATSEAAAADTQKALVPLVKLSPTLEEVVERDPSLLADQAYVARNNPQLAAFLAAHPEVTRNPDFYLFTEFDRGRGQPNEALDRRTGHDRPYQPEDHVHDFLNSVIPLLAFLGFMGACIWLAQTFLQNRRWTRVSRLQMETHTKLMEHFANNQELLAYMSSDAGRKFLEAAPFTLDANTEQKLPNAVSRILLSFQIGAVLTLLGAGLFHLRNSLTDYAAPLELTGIIVLMPGLGFLLSAAVTLVLAARLHMLPGRAVVDTGDWQ